MEEIWKDVKGYEGLYQVSSFGRVKCLSRVYVDSMGRNVHKKENILTPRLSAQTGYPTINLSKNDKTRTHSVHRLVAEAFIPNPKNLPCVNHKDESRDNNNVGNLEWCTYGYNNTYGTAVARRNASLARFIEEHLDESRAVIQYSIKGEPIREFSCIRQAEKTIGVGRGSSIVGCCAHKLKIAYGYVWRFKDDPFSLEEYKPKRHQKFVIKRDLQGNVVGRYKSVSEAARENGFERHALQKTNLIGGFTYEVEKKENEFIPTGHKGPRPDLVGKGAKKVYQYTRDGVFVAEFNSVRDAAVAMGDKKRASDISNCANGNLRSAFGFDWWFRKR